MYEGNTLKLLRLEDGLVELVFDLNGESVNKFGRQTVGELEQALDILEQEPLSGLLVSSAKPALMVGADITEFQSFFASGEQAVKDYLAANNRNFCRLEDLAAPVGVAIDGYALGGGMELCLACDYRIMGSGGKIGLPETQLGIVPGWGGTVRLPRLVGVDTAAEWIASGRQWRADAAFKAGVVDAVVETDRLRDAALHTLAECAAGRLDYQSRRALKTSPLQLNAVEAGMAFETAKNVVSAEAGPHYPAPIAAIRVMEAAASKGRAEALAIEAEAFAQLATGTEAQALVGIFLGEQWLGRQARQWQRHDEGEVSRAAVLGAGIMGGGIAYQSALKGVPVRMKDIERKGLDQGLREANRLLTKLVEKGRLSVSEMGQALIRIEPTLSYEGFDDVDIVVEAVVENARVKKTVLAEAEQCSGDDTVLASNTSTISITELSAALQRPEKFCGMHFFNPVHAMPLVEVIRGEKSSDSTIARTVAYASRMGKKPVVVRDCAGFLVNRVLFPYFSAFAMLVRDGVDYQRVDRVMERWGWPMGPAYLLDVVGLDTAIHAEAVMAEAYPDRLTRDYVSATEALYKAGRLGQKSSGGFYDYVDDRKGRPKKQSSKAVGDIIQQSGDNESITDETIVARMMIPMITELARCLDEEVVASATEADMAMVYGTGFPPFRGGPLRWVDAIGLSRLEAMAKPLDSLGALYQLPDSLKQRVRDNQPFYSVDSAENKGGVQ